MFIQYKMKSTYVSQQTHGIKWNIEQLSGRRGHSLINTLSRDSATVLHTYSHLYSLCWNGTAVHRATWWARSGNWSRLTKIGWWGNKRSHRFSVQFSPQPYKELFQHKRGRRRWTRCVQRLGCWSRRYRSGVHQPNPEWGSDDGKGAINVWWYKTRLEVNLSVLSGVQNTDYTGTDKCQN